LPINLIFHPNFAIIGQKADNIIRTEIYPYSAIYLSDYLALKLGFSTKLPL